MDRNRIVAGRDVHKDNYNILFLSGNLFFVTDRN